MFNFVSFGLAAAMAVTMLTTPLQPAQSKYRFASEDIALVFCAYVRDNDTARLQNKMRELRIRMRDVYSDIRCNGASLIQFALKTDSQKIGAFIVRSVTLKSLHEANDFNWAVENDFAETAIGTALSQRLER